MKVLLISVVLLQAWCNDENGKRYGGTYRLGDEVSPFSDPIISPYRAAYIPDFFNNFGNILQQDIGSDIESQRLAVPPLIEPFGLSYNSGGYNPTFSRFPYGGFPFGGFGPFNMDRLTHNSAFAGAGIGPGYSHQTAIINPANPENPNVEVTNRLSPPRGPGNFYSVSSSSFASSNNDNGKVSGFRGAETVVNDNGKVTKYRVRS